MVENESYNTEEIEKIANLIYDSRCLLAVLRDCCEFNTNINAMVTVKFIDRILNTVTKKLDKMW